jgi:hypothetical protein
MLDAAVLDARFCSRARHPVNRTSFSCVSEPVLIRGGLIYAAIRKSRDAVGIQGPFHACWRASK